MSTLFSVSRLNRASIRRIVLSALRVPHGVAALRDAFGLATYLPDGECAFAVLEDVETLRLPELRQRMRSLLLALLDVN